MIQLRYAYLDQLTATNHSLLNDHCQLIILIVIIVILYTTAELE